MPTALNASQKPSALRSQCASVQPKTAANRPGLRRTLRPRMKVSRTRRPRSSTDGETRRANSSKRRRSCVREEDESVERRRGAAPRSRRRPSRTSSAAGPRVSVRSRAPDPAAPSRREAAARWRRTGGRPPAMRAPSRMGPALPSSARMLARSHRRGRGRRCSPSFPPPSRARAGQTECSRRRARESSATCARGGRRSPSRRTSRRQKEGIRLRKALRYFGWRDSVQRPVDERGAQHDPERGAPSRPQLLLGRRELNQIDELVHERTCRRSSALLQSAANLGGALDRALAAVEELLYRHQLGCRRLRTGMPRFERAHRCQARVQHVAQLLAARRALSRRAEPALRATGVGTRFTSGESVPGPMPPCSRSCCS